MTPTLEIRLLGELELWSEGELVPLPASKKTRALLGYLVLTRAEHSRSRLCDLLWDGPADPRAALRWSLSKLRALVDADAPRVLADREHVRFDVAQVSVDLFEVRELLAGGLQAQETDVLETCAARFRGELLEGLELDDCFVYAQWLAAEREKARNLRTQLLATLSTRHDVSSERGLQHARAWVALEPLDESAHARLIEWLVRHERVDEARRAVDACRKLFERELGRLPRAVSDAALSGVRGNSRARESSVRAAAPPSPAPEREAGLFGRAEECAVLERFLEPAPPAERRRVLWIGGEPGIGKSRLLDELLQRARQRGIAALYGKAYEAEGTRPLAIWSEALGADAIPDQALGRARLFEVLLERLREADDGRGVVIALDDVQWIDEASAAFVSWLAREGGGGFSLALALRPGELEDNPAARRLLRSLTRADSLESLSLEPLAEPELLGLVRSINPDIDAARAFEQCGGNPLFAIEVARAGDLAASTRLKSCIAERLERLSDQQRELLRVGAAIGRRFSLELAAEVSGLRSGELLHAAESLERSGFVQPRGNEEYDFAHDLVRRATYDELSEPTRRLLHRRIARALSAHPRAGDEHAPELARQAALAEEHELAARACVAAGERCLRLFANEDATTFARRGLRHSPFLPAVDERELRAELLALEVHAGLGRRGPEHLRDELTRLAESARTHGEHETARNALYLLSVLEEEAGDFERAELRTLEAAAEGRGADPRTQARALANSGRCLAQLGRELEKADQLLQEAASREECSATLVDLPWGLGLLAWHRGQLAEATRQLELALRAATEAENHWAAFECLSRLALIDLEAGEPARALGRESALLEAAGSLAGGSEEALARALIALARYAGDGSAAQHEFEGALAALREQDSKAVLSTILNQAAELDAARGRAANVHAWAEEALEAARAVGRQRQVARSRRLLDPLHFTETPTEEDT